MLIINGIMFFCIDSWIMERIYFLSLLIKFGFFGFGGFVVFELFEDLLVEFMNFYKFFYFRIV